MLIINQEKSITKSKFKPEKREQQPKTQTYKYTNIHDIYIPVTKQTTKQC